MTWTRPKRSSLGLRRGTIRLGMSLLLSTHLALVSHLKGYKHITRLLIILSGVFMFAGANDGLTTTDRIFSDDDSEDIDKSTPDSALHRNVDLTVLKADEEG